MAGLVEWLDPFLSIATLAVAGLIVALARRSVAAVALAVYLAAWGAANLQATIIRAVGGSEALLYKIGWSLNLVSWAAVLAFAIVYPYVSVTRGRRSALVGVAIAAAVGVVAIVLSPDAVWYDPVRGQTGMRRIAGTVLGTAGESLPIVILGLRWFARRADAHRTQLAWGILPIAWWMLHDALGHTFYPWLFGGGPAPTLGHPILDLFVWLNAGGVLFTLAIGAVGFTRTMRGQGAGDDRALGFGILYMLPLTLVQVILPGSSDPILSTHNLLDYAVVPIAVYGVLRHRVVDIDLKLKRGLKRSTVAATFFGMFFVVTTIAQEFLTEAMGWLMGGLAAGLLLFALAPLQRIAERVSDVALPHVQADAGYLTYRRFQIYRVALEGTLYDGLQTPAETSALRRLRDELGISLADHASLESEVRARFAPAMP